MHFCNLIIILKILISSLMHPYVLSYSALINNIITNKTTFKIKIMLKCSNLGLEKFENYTVSTYIF